MICPFCKSDSITVEMTRKYDTCVIRIRFCDACLHSFKTVEQIELETPVRFVVVQSSEKSK